VFVWSGVVVGDVCPSSERRRRLVAMGDGIAAREWSVFRLVVLILQRSRWSLIEVGCCDAVAMFTNTNFKMDQPPNRVYKPKSHLTAKGGGALIEMGKSFALAIRSQVVTVNVNGAPDGWKMDVKGFRGLSTSRTGTMSNTFFSSLTFDLLVVRLYMPRIPTSVEHEKVHSLTYYLPE
jgi:hypothetical protein